MRASHDALVELFERIENFFRRLEIHTRVSLTSEMAEVFVKIVAEVLSILSIATKEVKRKRAGEDLLRTSRNILKLLVFDQKDTSGNYWEGRTLRMHSKN